MQINCRKCQTPHPRAHYRLRRNDRPHGAINRLCKDCQRAYTQENRAAIKAEHPILHQYLRERAAEVNKLWRAKNPDYHRNWRAKNRDKINAQKRARRAADKAEAANIPELR